MQILAETHRQGNLSPPPRNCGLDLAATPRLRHLLTTYRRIEANADSPPELKSYATELAAEIDAELLRRMIKAVA